MLHWFGNYGQNGCFKEALVRRLPVYLVLDCSGSMRGEPIQAVNRGIQLLVKTLQNNPVALETVWVSIITFSTEAQQLVPLTEVSLLQVPKIQAGGRTAMGAALLLRFLQNPCL